MSACPSGNWLSFLVRGKILIACLVFSVATSAFAQHVAFGFKTGVPLTDVVQTTGFSSLGYVPFQAETKGYTIGPVVDLSFDGPLGIEVGTMYKKIDQQAPQVSIVGYTCLTCEEGPYATYKIQRTPQVGRSWEFPVAVQYHFPLHLIRPYVEGGFSYNHLSDVLWSYPSQFPPFRPPVGFVVTPSVSSVNRSGLLFGGGAEIKFRNIHLTPGLRYTRYDKVEFFLPSPNAVDLLVKFHFLKF